MENEEESRPVFFEEDKKTQPSVLQYLQKDMENSFFPEVIPKSLQVRLAYHPAYQPCEDKEVLTQIKKDSKEASKALLSQLLEDSRYKCDKGLKKNGNEIVKKEERSACYRVEQVKADASPKQVQLDFLRSNGVVYTCVNGKVQSSRNIEAPNLIDLSFETKEVKYFEEACQVGDIKLQSSEQPIKVVILEDTITQGGSSDSVCQSSNNGASSYVKEIVTSDNQNIQKDISSSLPFPKSEGKQCQPFKSQVPTLVKQSNPLHHKTINLAPAMQAKEIIKPSFTETSAQVELGTKTVKRISEIKEDLYLKEATDCPIVDCISYLYNTNDARDVGVQVCHLACCDKSLLNTESGADSKGPETHLSPLKRSAIPVYKKDISKALPDNLQPKPIPITPKNQNSKIPILSDKKKTPHAKLSPPHAKYTNASTFNHTALNTKSKFTAKPTFGTPQMVSTPRVIHLKKYGNVASPVAKYLQMNPSPSLFQTVQAVEDKTILNTHLGNNLPHFPALKSDDFEPILPEVNYVSSKPSIVPRLREEYVEKIPASKFLASQKENSNLPIITRHRGTSKSVWPSNSQHVLKQTSSPKVSPLDKSIVEQVPLRYSNNTIGKTLI